MARNPRVWVGNEEQKLALSPTPNAERETRGAQHKSMTVHEPCPLFRVSLCTIHPVPTPATVAPSSPRTSVLWRMSASGGIEMKKLCFRDCGWWVECTDRKVRPVFVWSPQTDASRLIGSICEWGVVIARYSSNE